MMERFGDWMQTYSATRFWPLSPRADEIAIVDIAHALSLQCRYGGHCLRFYSVAEHSVLISRWLAEQGHDRATCLWGLLHDAGEAYVLDMIRPLKASMPEFRLIEQRVMVAITTRFGLYPHQPEPVTEADNRILVDEKRQNMAPGLAWVTDALEPLGISLRFWSPETAQEEFIVQFRRLARHMPGFDDRDGDPDLAHIEE